MTFSNLVRTLGVKRCSPYCACYFDILQLSLRLPVKDGDDEEFLRLMERRIEKQKRCKDFDKALPLTQHSY
jgi:hypothetical protein